MSRAEVPAETTTEWAIEWTDYPPDDPDRFEPRVDEASARKWAGYWQASGARAVSRTVTRSPWQPAPPSLTPEMESR